MEALTNRSQTLVSSVGAELIRDARSSLCPGEQLLEAADAVDAVEVAGVDKVADAAGVDVAVDGQVLRGGVL